MSGGHSLNRFRLYPCWLTVIAAALCLAALAGCAPSSAPAARGNRQTPNAAGAPLTNEDLTQTLPERTLSFADAQAAAAGLHLASVAGQTSSSSWLPVAKDGSFSAQGYFGEGAGSWEADDGTPHALVALKVPETVGGLTIVHAIPLIAGSDTRISLNGRRVAFSEFDSWSEDEESPLSAHWVEAKFSVQDGWIRADSITYTARPAPVSGTWPGPEANIDMSRLSYDASLPVASTGLWLKIGSDGSADLAGYGEFTTTEPPVDGFEGGGDLTVPDHLGPAVIYHLVQVFYTKAALVPPDASMGASAAAPFPLTKVHVVLDHGRLVGR